jgi:hypothetical protein
VAPGPPWLLCTSASSQSSGAPPLLHAALLPWRPAIAVVRATLSVPLLRRLILLHSAFLLTIFIPNIGRGAASPRPPA